MRLLESSVFRLLLPSFSYHAGADLESQRQCKFLAISAPGYK